MILIDHPKSFCSGTRVLVLTSPSRLQRVYRVTHDPDHFDETLDDLVKISSDGEKVYASAGERSIPRAIQEFRQSQLAAEYQDDPEQLYREIDGRWASCLMIPSAQLKEFVLFDCENEEIADVVRAELTECYDAAFFPYRYDAGSRQHIVTHLFDFAVLGPDTRVLIKENPYILWGY